ncbi:LexA family transcriptional regulator [Rhizobium halophytocola]|uniref:Transcriptional regulator with XRE-family HTH domain n=1 Tax=Rhizobium halophytocola TaxID=735519 RepID=A0ABS4E2I1_9HYPH|nr:helix-turn-helix domain-containing protein [Rhizobium halophytocola]MBP1852142.1 transcriptional regulator with XRE-family HTH domain [Rhizobium halophytocola]
MQSPLMDLKSTNNSKKSKPDFFSEIMMAGMTEWWERLEKKREELQWSKAELARRSGINYDSINKYLRGDISQPRGNILSTLAETLGVSAIWLREGIGAEDTEAHPSPSRLVSVIVAGRVEAGAFREVDQFDQSERIVLSMPADDRFPNARLMAFDVSGDSMNDLKPRPILPGDRAICVAYEDTAQEMPLRDGMVVVIERTLGGGHIREWSIKQVEIYKDRTEFHPRSTNTKHKPIIVPNDIDADDGSHVEVIGLVRRIVNDLPL